MSNTISRLEKLEKLDDPYPRDFPGRETIKSVLENNPIILTENNLNPYLFSSPKIMEVPNTSIRKIAGRISARRDHGYNIFFDIFDQTGEIQLHAKLAESTKEQGEHVWENALECDIGDMVGIEGTLGTNRHGEPLLLISNFTLLAKALKDPPANFHGVKNPEHKYRHREQDLMSSADAREVFKKRAEIVFEIRKYLNERDFIEIETPILQTIYGGATARPFVTQHNALSQQFYLAISSELYLKRALVGGYDRIYTFSRCFRNEGISPEHNPEFTNLEIFETCKNSFEIREFTLTLLCNLYDKFSDKKEKLILNYKYDFPSSDWPLSRKITSPIEKREFADAWEMFYNDMEIASGASDLNDPREQEKRLKESEYNSAITMSKESIDYDPYDQNYIEALEMGALPWAGVGIGIDRLCMLLLGRKNIREVLMFPLLKR